MIKKYSDKFYKSVDSRAHNSTEDIINVLDSCIYLSKIRTIIDIGCGSGAWIEAFLLNSEATIHGYDLEESIEMNEKRFSGNFENRVKLKTSNFELSTQLNLPDADLGLCLEVLEHLEDSTGKKIVQEISRSCNLVLFSAATPGQGGTGHINERQHQYWLNQFWDNGFEVYDVIRPNIQDKRNSARFYALNIFLLAKPTTVLLKDVANLDFYKTTRNVVDYRTARERIQFNFIKILPEKIVTQLSKLFNYK